MIFCFEGCTDNCDQVHLSKRLIIRGIVLVRRIIGIDSAWSAECIVNYVGLRSRSCWDLILSKGNFETYYQYTHEPMDIIELHILKRIGAPHEQAEQVNTRLWIGLTVHPHVRWSAAQVRRVWDIFLENSTLIWLRALMGRDPSFLGLPDRYGLWWGVWAGSAKPGLLQVAWSGP